MTLAIISSLSRLFAYLLCIAAVPALDAKAGQWRWWRGVLLPLVAAALSLWAAAQSRAEEWLGFAAFVLAGTILYAAARWARSRAVDRALPPA